MVIVISALALAVMTSTLPVPEAMGGGWIEFWGFKPSRISELLSGDPSLRDSVGLAGLVGALFAHSTWLHLAGNIAYLWVFGIPVVVDLHPRLVAGDLLRHILCDVVEVPLGLCGRGHLFQLRDLILRGL